MPTAHLLARGSWRANSNPNEPQPAAVAPTRPRQLSAESRKVWDAVIAVVGAGVVTKDNGQTLARYCHSIARWWKMAAWLDTNEDTYTVKDDGGNVRHLRHPNVITYEKLSRDLMRMEQEFGLTPASRTRIHANASNKKTSRPAPDATPTLKIAT